MHKLQIFTRIFGNIEIRNPLVITRKRENQKEKKNGRILFAENLKTATNSKSSVATYHKEDATIVFTLTNYGIYIETD